jgi:DNA (cytosine-5)-methyltransferase 1
MLTYYEFFAGGGMARAGLGDRWHCLLANDHSAKKAESYRLNWGSDHLLVRDVFDLTLDDLSGRAALAWASFPCQDLSLAGNRDGLSGARSSAFWGFWGHIRALAADGRKPKVIVLENVTGTLSSHEGRDFAEIAQAIFAEGYVLGAMVVDGLHFVPQSRPRLFIIAMDSSLDIPSALLTNLSSPIWHPKAVVRAYLNLSADQKPFWRWWSLPMPSALALTIKDLIENDPKDVTWHTQEQTNKLLEMMSPTNRDKVSAAQLSKRPIVGTIYKRTRQGEQRAEIRFDGVAGCLRTPGGGSSRQTLLLVEGGEIRSRLLSSREAARLMGLPDSYVLPEKYNDAYMLAGDGLVVPVVAYLAKHLIEPALESTTSAFRQAA